MRKCKVCNQEKSIDAFGFHKHNRDGRRKTCRECEAVYRRQWYHNGGKKLVQKWVKDYRDRTGYPGWSNPVHQRARHLSQSAIRRGKIKKRPCEVCGATEVEAHHDDYSKPLDVRFLCNKHHRAEHAIRSGANDE